MKKGENKLVIVSGTSWTPDEDFSILLDSIIEYDRYCKSHLESKRVQRIHIVITGKGPLKEYYSKLIK